MTNTNDVLRVGIASDADIKARIMAIAKGELKPADTDPKVWVRSMNELRTLLSDNNRMLIDAIRKAPGITVNELSEATSQGRTAVSRSLNQLATLGMISLEKQGRTVLPRVEYERLEIAL